MNQHGMFLLFPSGDFLILSVFFVGKLGQEDLAVNVKSVIRVVCPDGSFEEFFRRPTKFVHFLLIAGVGFQHFEQFRLAGGMLVLESGGKRGGGG